MKMDAFEPVMQVHDKKCEQSPLWRIYSNTNEYARANDIDEHDLNRLVLFDLDNTLYPASSGVSLMMRDRIRLFLMQHVGLPEEEALEVGSRFYNDYGLAIKGCVKHLDVDPQLYDRFVDGGLDLENLLEPLRGEELEAVRGVRGRRWIFTNAGRVHAERVLRILNITHLFEAVVHCVYTEPDFPAKPNQSAYERVLQYTGHSADTQVYFVDDSERNVEMGRLFGWKSACLAELEEQPNSSEFPIIRSLCELPRVFPELYNKRAQL